MAARRWTRDGYTISDDPNQVDMDVVHGFLSTSYWAEGIPRALAERAVKNSLPFSIFESSGAQVGFARMVTDRATFGYLADVFVLPAHRGRGLSKWLMDVIDAHPDLQGFRRWVLVTKDAHGLYLQKGWKPLAKPANYLERFTPNIYEPRR